MKKSQGGFTLIELVVVIVLLGILGVTALGKFQDLSGEASQAAVEGVASELSAAASINYAKGILGTPALAIGNGETLNTTVNGCLDTGLAELFATGSFPSGYTTTLATATCVAGDTYNCTITGDNAKTAVATLICTN